WSGLSPKLLPLLTWRCTVSGGSPAATARIFCGCAEWRLVRRRARFSGSLSWPASPPPLDSKGGPLFSDLYLFSTRQRGSKPGDRGQGHGSGILNSVAGRIQGVANGTGPLILRGELMRIAIPNVRHFFGKSFGVYLVCRGKRNIIGASLIRHDNRFHLCRVGR